MRFSGNGYSNPVILFIILLLKKLRFYSILEIFLLIISGYRDKTNFTKSVSHSLCVFEDIEIRSIITVFRVVLWTPKIYFRKWTQEWKRFNRLWRRTFVKLCNDNDALEKMGWGKLGKSFRRVHTEAAEIFTWELWNQIIRCSYDNRLLLTAMYWKG